MRTLTAMKHLQLRIIPVFLLMSGCGAEVDVHQAAADGNVTVVKKKLDAGMDLHHRDELYQLTLLHDASQFGQMEVAELLIARGADLNAKDKVGATPLHYAALGGHIGIINLLVAKGAELNKKAEIKDATTPMDWAKSAINALKPPTSSANTVARQRKN